MGNCHVLEEENVLSDSGIYQFSGTGRGYCFGESSKPKERESKGENKLSKDRGITQGDIKLLLKYE